MHPDAYTVSLPYPESRPCRQDLRMARRLFPMYTGCAGELAAISGYLYAALRTEENTPELGRIFDDLARTEMHHFRILGRLIRDLGADPFIRARIDGSQLPLELQEGCCDGRLRSRNTRILLEQSLHSEQTAADNYRFLCTQTDDEAVRAQLHRIMQDEEKHVQLFESMLK